MNKPELQNRYQLFIGGQWRDASDGEFFTTKCPANGEKLAECAQAAKEDVDDAVREAWKAFETWKKVPTSERAAILNKIADIIDANTEHLAMVESLDNGKPIRETMAIDIPLSAKHFRYFAGCITAEEGSANILDEQFLSLSLWQRGSWLRSWQPDAAAYLNHPATHPFPSLNLPAWYRMSFLKAYST